MDAIIKGKKIDPKKEQNKVRDWDKDKNGGALI
jgi:hypothetical protein